MPRPTNHYTFTKDRNRKRRMKPIRDEPIWIEFVEGDAHGCTLRINGLELKQVTRIGLPPNPIVFAGEVRHRAS